MSNFICSECGMTNIDCGYAGYKTPKEIEQGKQIADLSKKVERLQEQLKEANELLLDFCSEDECRFDHNGYCQEHDSCDGGYKCIQKDLKHYLKKWSVK